MRLEIFAHIVVPHVTSIHGQIVADKGFLRVSKILFFKFGAPLSIHGQVEVGGIKEPMAKIFLNFVNYWLESLFLLRIAVLVNL